MASNFPSGIKGGAKSLWLRVHKSEVLAFYETYGTEKTMMAFQLQKDTLSRLLEDTRISPELTDAEKALLRVEVVEQGLRDNRKVVQELREQYGLFTDLVSDRLANRFFKPLLHGVIGELPAELEEKPDCALCPAELVENERKSKLKRH